MQEKENYYTIFNLPLWEEMCTDLVETPHLHWSVRQYTMKRLCPCVCVCEVAPVKRFHV